MAMKRAEVRGDGVKGRVGKGSDGWVEHGGRGQVVEWSIEGGPAGAVQFIKEARVEVVVNLREIQERRASECVGHSGMQEVGWRSLDEVHTTYESTQADSRDARDQ